jgi:pyrroline-5-carboxylate reductase
MNPPSPRDAHPLIGFIGAGNMARSLVSGLLKNGWRKNQIVLSDPDPSQRQAIESVLGVKTFADNQAVVINAEILVLAVKPQVLAEAAMALAPAAQKKKPLIISIAAGVRLADIDRWLGGGLPIVRAMPNTAALIGSGASGLYANKRVNDAMRNQAESILRAVGVTVWLGEESLMDVVTALSGSGPAYFFLVMEALEQASIESGLDPKQARLLTLETAYGAAKMALEGHEEPSQLRHRVTSPGGTTEQAVKVLENGDIRRLFRQAVQAAVNRSREIADLFGKKA